MIEKQISEYMAKIGRKGGKAATNQAEASRAYWDSMTPAQRSERAREAARKAWETRRANGEAAKTGTTNGTTNGG